MSCLSYLCTALHNCSSSGSLVFATIVILLKQNMNIAIYYYDTLLQTFTLIEKQ